MRVGDRVDARDPTAFDLEGDRSGERAVDLAAHPVRAFANDTMAGEGDGSVVLGDPRIALTWLVNELSRHQMTLRAGEVVTTGTCVKPVAIAAGETISGDFGPLGRVAVTIKS